MTLTGKSWEIAEEHNLKCYYAYHNGNANGAAWFYDGNECVAVFEVVDEWGFGDTYCQELQLLQGTWPPTKKGEKES